MELEVSKMKGENELILCIVDAGFSDSVMSAARECLYIWLGTYTYEIPIIWPLNKTNTMSRPDGKPLCIGYISQGSTPR